MIIVHDSHGAGAEYGAGTAAGWVSGHTATGWTTGGGADSYSAGTHIGGGDNTYAGAQDSYSSGKRVFYIFQKKSDLVYENTNS